MSGELRAILHSGQTAGTLHTRSPLDGVEGMSSYRKVPNYPVHILVGRATDEYLAQWRTEATKVSLLVALFCLISATLLWLV